MSTTLSKSSILKKTAQVGSSTLISRLLGLVREVLTTRYLGTKPMADAFFTAFKIPNMLRKIFAEGALSAAFIPTLVKVVRKDKQEASSLISLGFLVFEGFLVIWCAFIMINAQAVLNLIVPGWSADQIAQTIPYLRILMPFILLVSSSALLAGALQSIGHFFVPAFAPVLLNVVYVVGLVVCMLYHLPVEYLCYFIMIGGIVQFLMHLYIYFKLKFNFAPINKQTLRNFFGVLIKFIPCFVTMSIGEASVFIGTSLASYLPSGSIALIYYAFRFMNIPLGVFAVAFSTILLPHFTRVGSYAPQRLSFYLLETTKFVFWVTVPATILMIFFSEKIFHTIFLSDNFPLESVQKAAIILSAFLLGLFFFSLNKILLNIYFALHVTWIPTLISLLVTFINVVFDYILMARYGAPGLALATTLSIGILQTLLLVLFLFLRFDFKSYLKNFMQFLAYYLIQLIVVLLPAFGVYKAMEVAITSFPQDLQKFFLYGLGFWFWVGPLCVAIVAAIYYSRKLFKVNLYFLNAD